ncbi:MAG: manganese efflux pump MntP, partial [Solirubrobacteraceae bacterium]
MAGTSESRAAITANVAGPTALCPTGARAYACVLLAKLLALVLPLGLDTLAVSAALGTIGLSPPSRLRVSVLFTAFEAGMPLIGLALGAPLGHAIGKAADYVAIGVLLGFGLYTLFSHDEADEQRLAELVRPRGFGAVLLGLSISMDELAIGFTLGL